MFNTDCIGDTISVVGNEKIIENNIDSKTLYYPATWTNNSKKYGIPLQITSVGKIQGEFIPKGTSPYDIINKWDKNYPDYPNKDSYSDQSSARNHKNRLAEIKATFKKMIDEGKILVAGGGVYSNKETNTTKPTVKKVVKVSLSKKSVVLVKGRSTTVKATVTPTNATNKKLKWTTSNAKVATVNQSGKITAKGRGNATIKVMALDGSNKYATVKVTVKQPVTSVKLNRNSAILKVKGKAKHKTVTLKATVNPKNANVKSVKWTTSKSKIATVNSKGKVTAKKAGKVTITATCKDAKGKKAKFTVTVKAAPAPAKVVTPETVKPVVKDNTAEYTGLVANADKYVLTRGKQTVEISAAQVKEALGYIADPAAGFKAWESKENFTLGVLSATGKGATKTATIKGTSNYDGKYTATVTKVSDTEYAVVAKSEKGQNHNIKVTVAKDGTVTATSAKYVVTSDKNATNIVVKDAAGKVIASATAKDGKYTVKLPADKAKDLTITQYVACLLYTSPSPRDRG